MTRPSPDAYGFEAADGAVDPADVGTALHLLRHGRLSVEGRLVAASNATMYCSVELDDIRAGCVYKPVSGERPLWDFPDGTLADREVAAYLVSEAAGWGVVPPTVLRDGPLGPGACQLWIDETDDGAELVGFVRPRRMPAGWFRIAAAHDDSGRAYALAHADDPRLARMAVFDAVVNNADRKGGHVITGAAGRVYGVDHGVCFHVEPKLRTILWGWAGEPLPSSVLPVLRELAAALAGELGATLASHLTRAEVAATEERVAELLETERFPVPGDDWPAMPWPPV
jgi:uncharacterized repeat protein (TIGR03843 family)